jgi:S-adenosylmethionine hydrolase
LSDPDNGIFSRIYENEDGWKVYRIDESEYQLPKSSSTFNGRDAFAPVAAWLSRGIAPDRIGVEISDPVRLTPLRPGIDLLTGRIVAAIINIDRFGNCVTSLTPDDLPVDEVDGQGLLVAGSVIDQFCDCFGAAQYPERPFAYPGSAGYWEIGCWYDSAADRLGIRTGDQVVVDFSRGDQ